MMGIDVIVTTAIAVAGAVGGFAGGRSTGNSNAMGIATDTVELLQVQVDSLVQRNREKDSLINDLHGRVETLESLITQRAEVEAVHVEVKEVRGVVDKIASKVGA